MKILVRISMIMDISHFQEEYLFKIYNKKMYKKYLLDEMLLIHFTFFIQV